MAGVLKGIIVTKKSWIIEAHGSTAILRFTRFFLTVGTAVHLLHILYTSANSYHMLGIKFYTIF